MAGKYTYPGRYFRHTGLVVFLFLLCSTLFAQTISEDLVKVEISSKSVVKKEKFIVTVIVNHPESSEIKIELPLQMEDEGLSLYSGPRIRRRTELSLDKISLVKKTSFEYTFRAGDLGRKVIYPFLVSINELHIRTEALLIEVGVIENRRFYIPYDAYWQSDVTEAYVGESIPLALYIQNELQVGIFPRVKTVAPNGGFWEEVTGLGEIDQKLHAGNILYSIPVAGYIFTPSRSGRLIIPSAQIESDTSEGKAASIVISVNPMPEEIEATGAIGEFLYTSEIVSKQAFLGEEIVLKVAVSGEGNFSYLQIPDPIINNLEFLESRREEAFSPFSGGYAGFLIKEFIYRTVRSGEAVITTDNFTYLNKDIGVIKSIAGSSYVIDVLPPFLDKEENIQYFNIISAQIINKKYRKALYNQGSNYFLLLPGILSLIAAFIFKKKKAAAVLAVSLLFMAASPLIDSTEDLNSWRLYEQGEFFKAGSAFYNQALDLKHNSGFFYNSALSFFKSGDIGKAVLIMRKAICLEPGNNEYRSFIKYIQQSSELPFQEGELFSVHPDLFFILFLIFWNLCCFGYTVMIFRKGSIMIMVMIFITLLTIVFASAMFVSSNLRSTNVGIVKLDSTKVRKIPRSDSGAGYLLNSGQSIQLEGYSEPFYLIETKNGITGWLHKNDVYLDNTTISEFSDRGKIVE